MAAILAADVVAYSKLMGEDEEGTHRQIKALERDVITPAVERHHGRVVKTTGDGFLIEFPSPVEAVRCALAIQSRTSAGPLRLRIGINLGDVIIETDGDVYGEGVNVAARLEALCDPGGVLVSGKVYDEVEGKVEAAFESRGEQQVKNIAKPVRVHAVTLAPRAQSRFPATENPTKPSIAVLPFTNLSGDPEQDYFADGMVDEITTGLSRLPWLTVIGRNSAFSFRHRATDVRQIGSDLRARYVLEGSVRKAGGRVRITTQLVEAAGGGQLWANRFEGSLDDVFELQDQITEGVVGALEPMLRKAEIARVKRKRPEDLDAYDLYLRALAHMYEVRPEARSAALDYIARALAIDPDFAEAHGVAAWCYFAKSLWEGGFPPDYREGAVRHARAVQALQSEDASTLAHAAIALAFTTRDYPAAQELIDRALALNPNSVHAHGHGSVISTWSGQYERSLALAERALRLSPFDPLAVMPLAGKAGALLMLGRYEESLAAARRALQVYPTHTPSFLISIVSLVRLGRDEQAKAVAKDFLSVFPTYRIVPDWPVLGNFCDELRAAGIPG
jgi:adenylate cyclase